MSDRTYAQVDVLACPEDQRAALVAVLDGTTEIPADFYPLTLGSANEAPEDDTAPIGRYGWDELALGSISDIASALIEAAPGATFHAWEDPKYEYPGGVVMYAPDLGRFDADCDANGQPYVTAWQVQQAADLDTLRRETGVTWAQRMYELRKAAGDIIERDAAPVSA
jgi:hypothetical protein